jgi:FkbM family methyltransferase
MGPHRVTLKCGFTLGDIVALTGAVRELHEQYPGAFLTDVETAASEVWWYNPYISSHQAPAEIIDCNRVTIDRTGALGRHYIAAYLDLLNHHLGTHAKLRRVAGDIYLSRQEKDWYSEIWNFCQDEIPFWIVCPGGKFDLPIKWWSHDRYQKVVDHFRGRIQFVQAGHWGNYHPKVEGTIDLRGKLGIRDLIHLMYYAQGVLCGVTSFMHLAAAVPTETGQPREAVIIAGAREPGVWEKYPHHRYLDTNREVPCSACWKHRHIDLPDRGRNNDPDIRCSAVTNSLPTCMDLVTTGNVIGAIESSLTRVPPLSASQRLSAERAVSNSLKGSDFDRHNIHPLNAVASAETFIASIPRYNSRRFKGRGIVLCGGGVSYFTNAWVCINMLRFHGCSLPIELWHLGKVELDREMEELLKPLGVRCINAREVMNRYPMRNPLGWELKSYALLHSSFREVLLLDADNVAVRNPEYLFDSPEYRRTGAIFWPDYRRLGSRRAIWKMCGVKYRDEPEFESGQIVVHKENCWAALNLAFWYNDHSEFFYQYIHGDKETFHMAWRKLGQDYSMVPYPIHPLAGTMCQHDFQGTRLFQHRNLRKWTLWSENEKIPGFFYEKECIQFLASLRQRWNGTIAGRREFQAKNGFFFRKGTFDENIFRSVALANEYELPGHFAAEDVIVDVGGHIGSFAATCHARGSRQILCFEASRENTALARRNLKNLSGVTVLNRAILHRAGRVDLEPFPHDLTGENTGGSSIRLNQSGLTRAISLDQVLLKYERVRILKLDCEGSEWPILLFSKKLDRVEEICGEFHQMREHPLCPGISPLNRDLLRRVLMRNFPFVRTQLDSANPKLGKFWASRKAPEQHASQLRAHSRKQPAPPAEAPFEPARAHC